VHIYHSSKQFCCISVAWFFLIPLVKCGGQMDSQQKQNYVLFIPILAIDHKKHVKRDITLKAVDII